MKLSKMAWTCISCQYQIGLDPDAFSMDPVEGTCSACGFFTGYTLKYRNERRPPGHRKRDIIKEHLLDPPQIPVEAFACMWVIVYLAATYLIRSCS